MYGQQIDSELDAVAEGSGWQVEHFYESYDPAEIDEKRYTFQEFKLGYEHIRLSIKEDSVGAIVLFECGDSHPYLDDYEDKEVF